MKKIIIVEDYITYGYPTKKIVNDLVRKRGFLKKDDTKLAITDNVLIEELLGTEDHGPNGCICVEDIIDNIWKCKDDSLKSIFTSINQVMWPFQLGSLKETIEEANVEHDAHGRDVRRKNTRVAKGGYIGFNADQINDFVKALI